MAFLKELLNLQMTCFNHDELEEMLQWFILQRGDAKERDHGMITHYFDENRHMHFFHYLEMEDEMMEDGIWRVDVHYDSGRESDTVVTLEEDFQNFSRTEDERFDTSLPVNWKQGDKTIPVLLELANKNDLQGVKAGEAIACNVNMYAYNANIIHTKKDYNAEKKQMPLPEIGDLIPAGLIYSSLVAENADNRNEDFEKMMQFIVDEYRVLPFSFVQGIFKIRDYQKVALGGNASLYDITVECEGAPLHVLVPGIVPTMQDLKKGRYLDVNGMLVGMVLPEEDIRHKPEEKNNLLQFKPAN